METDDPTAIARTAIAQTSAQARAALAEPWLTAAFCDPKYVVQSHHRVMSSAIREWADTPDGRLGISAPPRCGKSWMSIVWATFWLLARDPTCEIIIACCTQKLVDQHSTDIRDRIGTYGDAFGIRIRKGHNRGDGFTLETGGHVLMVGLGGMATGFGADYFLIDDAFRDWKEAASPTQRDSKWLWASSVARTRLYPGGRLMHTGTRWNPDDLEGRFKKTDPGWRSVRIPAIADSPDDPLKRTIGEPLPVPQIAESDRNAHLNRWEKIKSTQPFMIWECMYQGNETPGGKPLVTPELLTEREHLACTVRPLRVAVSIDPSVGKRSAALASETEDLRQHTCGIMAGFLGVDKRVYLTDDATGIMKIEEWATTALLLAYRRRASVVFVEDNQGGDAWRILLSGTWVALTKSGKVAGPCPRIVSHNTRESKEVRADTLAGYIETDRVRTTANLVDYYSELLTWRPGLTSPGRIDSAGHLATKLLPDDALPGVFDGELVAAAVSPVTPTDVELPDYTEDDE